MLDTNHGRTSIGLSTKWRQLHLPVRLCPPVLQTSFLTPLIQIVKTQHNSKTIGNFRTCMTLLDDVATSVVSAATSGAYLASQVHLPFDAALVPVFLIIAVGLLGLLEVHGGAGITSGALAIHVSSTNFDICGRVLTSVLLQLVCMGALMAFRSSTGFDMAIWSSARTGALDNLEVERASQEISFAVSV